MHFGERPWLVMAGQTSQAMRRAACCLEELRRTVGRRG
eukprot:COSAG02_NODE_62918_length_264_cov_1.236364_1_plen_37_part_10